MWVILVQSAFACSPVHQWSVEAWESSDPCLAYVDAGHADHEAVLANDCGPGTLTEEGSTNSVHVADGQEVTVSLWGSEDALDDTFVTTFNLVSTEIEHWITLTVNYGVSNPDCPDYGENDIEDDSGCSHTAGVGGWFLAVLALGFRRRAGSEPSRPLQVRPPDT
jgi:hypothetical protein